MNGFTVAALLPTIDKFTFLQSKFPPSSFQIAMEAAQSPLLAHKAVIDKMAALYEMPAMKMARLFSQPKIVAKEAV